jgi:1,4-dihydroxy-2-naphthoyl-CoA hydrolase
MEIGDFDEDRVAGSFEVTDSVRQPFGIVHGGAYAAFAETLASVATYFAVQADGSIAVGQNNDTSFLRPVSEGTVHALGTRRHRGRTSWVWDFDFSDDQGRVCAISRVTIAVRPAPPS